MTTMRRWAVLSLLAALAGCAAQPEPVPPPPKPTVLITGANRGIGFEFARQFAAQDWRVIATARRPDEATELRALAAADPDVTIEPLDVTDFAAVDALAARYRGTPIDVLLLNAALGPTPQTAMSPLAKLDFDVARASFATNAIAPLKLAREFMDSVAASRRKLIVAMGTDSGSFEASVKRPVLYHYKASKAALHMYMHTLSFEAPKRGVTVTILHPGLVGTNPNLMRFPGALKTEDSVAQMMRVIEGLTPADNGRFVDYRGEPMPW
jgi:NAD(P)-dependent dehydrogenase (short-subunit alcohol dehydrogenase family)